MSSFTGFNPAQLIYEINEFYNEGADIHTNLTFALHDFYDVLYKSWYSPRAVEFESKMYDMNRCISNMFRAYENSVSSMIDAYNTHARNNNMSLYNNPYSEVEYLTTEEFNDMHFESVSPNGDVGMIKNAVSKARDEYVASAQRYIEKVFASCQKLSFYDESDSQVMSFIHAIREKRDIFQQTLYQCLGIIAQAIDEEVDITDTAASNAASILGQ